MVAVSFAFPLARRRGLRGRQQHLHLHALGRRGRARPRDPGLSGIRRRGDRAAQAHRRGGLPARRQAPAHHPAARRIELRHPRGQRHQGAAGLRGAFQLVRRQGADASWSKGAGGPSWYTEYNVLAGLSSRSFGRFQFFVTRIAAGRVSRGLPHALRRCGYRTFSIYPVFGGFLGTRSFYKGAGVENFIDGQDIRGGVFEPDRFYFDHAARMIAQRARPRADVPARLPDRQPFPLRVSVPAGADAGGVARSRQCDARGQRISAAAGDDRARLQGFRRPAQARIPRRVVPDRAVRRSPARFRQAHHRSGHRCRRAQAADHEPTIRATTPPTTPSTRSISAR